MITEAEVAGTTVEYVKNGRRVSISCRDTALANRYLEAVVECASNPNMTLNELWTLYHRCHAEVRLKTQSLESYTSLVTRHILPHMGDRKARDLSVGDVFNWIHALHVETRSYRSIGPIVDRLQAMLSKAVIWGLLDRNVVKEIDGFFIGNRPVEIPDNSA